MKRRRSMYILLGVILFFIVINVIPNPNYNNNSNNIWRKQDKPLVISHAGGRLDYPGNTLSAFKNSFDLGVDVFEIDIQMTSDNVLVLRHGENHTGNIKKMSNCDMVIWKYEYQYLYDNCNFGYNYEKDGEYPYRDMSHNEWVDSDVYLLRLEELFLLYGDSILYIIEIKADADAPRTETADELYNLIKSYNLLEEVMVATSFDDISKYITNTYPDVQISASHDEAQKMILQTYSLTSMFYNPGSYGALQLPTSFDLGFIDLDLSTKLLINTAHNQNMAIHYWTINDELEMRRLIDLGCDGIITDNPKLLIEIINE